MLDVLKEMGVETLSVQPEMRFSQEKLFVAMAITFAIIILLRIIR